MLFRSVSFEGDKLSDVYPSYTFLNDMVCENQDVSRDDILDLRGMHRNWWTA